MKKILNFILDPRKLTGLCSIFFILALIDVNVQGATDFSGMSWFGTSSLVGMILVIGIVFVRYFLLPAIGWIKELFNK